MSLLTSTPLAGKVAIVTGGSSGIGRAIVNLFLSAGAKVGVLDIQSNAEIANHDTLHFVNADITSEDSIQSAVREILSRWGQLDVLVNNAGIMDRMSRTLDVSNEVWDRVFAINVTGPMYLSRLAIRCFLSQESRGTIVNVCSTASLRGSAAGAAYTASKHALLGLSRSTAWGYAKDGIRCNAVLPGGTATSIMRGIGVDVAGLQILQPYMGTMPGTCQPSDIAAAVLFVATANAVNGAEVCVDHGWLTS